MLEIIASILVDLSDQTLTALDRQDRPVRVIRVSTGRAVSPTPVLQGEVISKYRSVTMRGRDYVAPDVPWAMCVTRDESICLHAAPWQERDGQAFGVPRSHGCVRMPTSEARWLFERTELGTPVTIRE
jgi:lipoprotein-anchoring transpeptidase ErfK/SrfK